MLEWIEPNTTTNAYALSSGRGSRLQIPYHPSYGGGGRETSHHAAAIS